MLKKTKGSLTIVGAGPRDAELITLKGLNAIKKAEVILYDALVNTEILAHNT
jgi:uroporphyrin-III C-methyltransferase